MHLEWINELNRVLKPGGLLLVTTQGDAFRVKLTAAELKQFNDGKLVVRGAVKEGHRTFSAFQPKQYMLWLFEKMLVLEHQTPVPEDGKEPHRMFGLSKNLDKR
ncbi:MAG: hypothetical protein Kow0027_03890 [Saprospiraceae bacterium]